MSETLIDVRHPYVGEVPAELMVGFEAFKIDPEWQWVLVADGKIMAQVLCANTHGVLAILRITSLKGAPYGWALRLLRAAFRECRELGLMAYMTVLLDSNPAEVKLKSIIKRHGGYIHPLIGVWVVGRLEK